jgi:hypothetical protein
MRLGKANSTGTPIKDDLCEVAAGYVRPTGCVSIVVMHNKQPHMLVLWADDLRELAVLCDETRAKMKTEHAA